MGAEYHFDASAGQRFHFKERHQHNVSTGKCLGCYCTFPVEQELQMREASQEVVGSQGEALRHIEVDILYSWLIAQEVIGRSPESATEFGDGGFRREEALSYPVR